MDWRPEFVDGNVRASCSICGVSRRAPDNLTLGPDKRWRCERCMEVSEYEFNRQLAGYRKRKPEPDTGFGLSPWDEAPVSFLAAAQARQAQLIPGWTPTTTFQDTFAIIPGGGGSAWTVITITSGAVTLPSAGLARLTTGATGGSLRISNTAVSVPDPSAGRFYCAFRFKTSALSATSQARAGAFSGTFCAAGINAAAAVFYDAAAGITARSSVEMDLTSFHLGEMWWSTGHHVFASIDGGPYLDAASPTVATRNPVIIVQGVSTTMDVTDYVCFV